MGSQIAVAIQANHLFQDVLRRSKESQALYEFGLAQREKFGDVSEILRAIVDQARQLLGGETPQPMCFAIDSPTGIVGVQHRRVQGLGLNLLVPGVQQFGQTMPHGYQTARGQLHLQMIVGASEKLV